MRLHRIAEMLFNHGWVGNICLRQYDETGSGADVFFIRHNHARHQIDEELTMCRFEARQQLILSSECART